MFFKFLYLNFFFLRLKKLLGFSIQGCVYFSINAQRLPVGPDTWKPCQVENAKYRILDQPTSTGTTNDKLKWRVPQFQMCFRKGTAERQAVNTRVQGSAADLVKISMVRIEERLETMYPHRIPFKYNRQTNID